MDTYTETQTDIRGMTFSQILKDMNAEGQFKASFLVDSQGLPVAAVTSDQDADTASAMFALVRKVIKQVQSHINLSESDEVTIRGSDKIRLVSRYFSVGNENLILVAIVPLDRSYRKLTNQAIRDIKATLEL